MVSRSTNRSLEDWVGDLAAKGIQTQRDEGTGQIAAQVELVERGVATVVVRADGVFLAGFTPNGGAMHRMEAPIDVEQVDDRADLALLVDGLIESRLREVEPQRPPPEQEMAHAASSLAGADQPVDTNDLAARDFSRPLSTVASGIGGGNVPGFASESPAPTSGPTLAHLTEFFGDDAQMLTFEAQSVIHFGGRVLGVRARMQGGELQASVHEGGRQIHAGGIPRHHRSLLNWLADTLGSSPFAPAPGPAASAPPMPAPAPAPAPAPVAMSTPPEPAAQETFFGADDLFGAPGGDLGGDLDALGGGGADWLAPPADDPPVIDVGGYWRLRVQPEDPLAMLVRYVVLDRQGQPYGNHITLPQRDFHVLFGDQGDGDFSAKVRVTGRQGDDVLYVHVDRADRMLSNPIALDLDSWRACFEPL